MWKRCSTVALVINNKNNKYADADVSNTAMETGAAASLAATNKTNKYSQLSATHIFTPVAIETAGTWNHQAVELVQELGRRATIITGDSRETPGRARTCSGSYPWLCKRGTNAVWFQNTFAAGLPFVKYLCMLFFTFSV